MSRAPKPNRRFTVQGWQNLVLIAMGVIVLAGAVTGGLLINRTDDVSHELVDDIQPARVGAYRLQAALSDQETATRGYALTGNRQFLDPYYQGLQEEQTVVDGMKQRLAGRPELLADLDAVETAAKSWRASYAEPLIASVQPGAANVVDSRTVDRGKMEFDGIRTALRRAVRASDDGARQDRGRHRRRCRVGVIGCCSSWSPHSS